MHSLAERVLGHIRRQELLRAGDRVGVAVSGGIDSVALLRLLLQLRGELGIVLSVVHFNHKLRGAESDADEQFVAGLARQHDLEFLVDSDDVARHAAEEGVSVEAAARELRYGFFRSLTGKPESPSGAEAQIQKEWADRSAESAAPPKGGILSKLATGHTLDDQAETVLMRMIRGAGMRGMGGIYPRIPLEDDDGEVCGEIVRPLLGFRRRELEQYLKDMGQPWREDSSNTDEALTRNRVRKLVLPLLEKEFNPAVAENLAELAEIARDEEDYWENEAAGWMGTVVHWSEPEWARDAANEAGLVQIGPPGKSGQGLKPESFGAADGIPSKQVREGIQFSPAEEKGPQGLKPAPSFAPNGTAEAVPFPTVTSPAVPFPDSHAAVSDETARSAALDSDLRSRIERAPWLVANASVSRLWLLAEPVAVQRRLVKAIGEQAGIPLEFKHVEEILRLAAEAGPSRKQLSLPLGWKVAREAAELLFLTPDLREQAAAPDYDYELPAPGRTVVPEIESVIEVQHVPAEGTAEYNPDHLLDAESVAGPLRVRNWRPGDRFWPAHTKSPKKIKELLQQRHVAQPERRLWPVVVSGDEIVWMRGFPSPVRFRAKLGREAVVIVESRLAGKQTT